MPSGDGVNIDEDPTTYTPGEHLQLHLRVLRPGMKYIGLLLYAVDELGNRVGEWTIPPESPAKFSLPLECGLKAVMQATAEEKNYHEVLTFVAPPAGAGRLTFRALVKWGETNGGAFFWPGNKLQQERYLELEESTAIPSVQTWYMGAPSVSCDDVCADKDGSCDVNALANVQSGETLHAALHRHHSCKLPMLQSCEESAPAASW